MFYSVLKRVNKHILSNKNVLSFFKIDLPPNYDASFQKTKIDYNPLKSILSVQFFANHL